MLLLRLLILLVAILLVVNGGMYVFTRDAKYLNIAWQIVRFMLLALLVFALLYILERYVLVGWRVLI
jgi:hypothetical protein